MIILALSTSSIRESYNQIQLYKDVLKTLKNNSNLSVCCFNFSSPTIVFMLKTSLIIKKC